MNEQTIVLGGGCFWCLEAAFQLVKGVTEVIPGYAGGSTPNPRWEEVCSGRTGHAEVVRVSFNPAIITLQEVLEVFWAIHDPTTLNRQGYDVGTEYRSIILFTNEKQKKIAEESIKAIAKLWPDPLVTELIALEQFYSAEEYHRNYFKRHPEQAYCQIIINPKLKKLREKFAAKLE